MERTKGTNDGLVRWKKTGGGFFRMKSGKIIKPGQVFSARVSDIPAAFRDTIIPLDGEGAVLKRKDIVKVPELEYTVRHKGGAWYDIVNKDGKVLNDKSLRKEDAEKLVTELKG